jgi:aspartate/methionine/tyrosine aminotransferase
MKPFIVMELLARAQALEAAGHSVVHMEVGEPDLPPPEPCRAAAIAAVRENRNRYTASFGLPELRRAITAYYRDVYGVEVPFERVVATTGTSGAFLLVLGGLFRRGDRIAITDPGYACYPNFCEFLGLETVRIPVDAVDGFRPRLDRVDAALAQGPIAGMILTSPSNPTGAMLPKATYQAVLERVPMVISDEIYHGIVVGDDAPAFTGAEFGERVVVIDGFSKKWSLTGGRIGWVVLPAASLDHQAMLTQNLFICPPTMAQHAGLAALSAEGLATVRERRVVYRERVDAVAAAVEALGLRVPCRPQGAFYLYVDVGSVTDDSYAFCFDLLERGRVAITPGADFGEHQAARHVRLSLANSLPNLLEGVRRLGAYLTAGHAGRLR